MSENITEKDFGALEAEVKILINEVHLLRKEMQQVNAVINQGKGALYHALFDTNRGTNNRLFSNTTDAEDTTANTLTSFNSDGFTLGSQTGQNQNGATFVGWQWRGSDSTAVTNTAGSITSTVSANTTSGFSVVTYTEPASGSYTVGHGLGVTPSMFILKERNVSGDNWVVWHNYWQSVDPIPTKKGQYLNSTLASFTTGSDWLNSASSTTLGITTGQVTAGSILAKTDWMVIRKAERDVAIPADVVAYRASVVAKADELEASITAVTSVEQLASLDLSFPQE